MHGRRFRFDTCAAGIFDSITLTRMLPNYFALFFIHLKLELLTQFPAPNDEK